MASANAISAWWSENVMAMNEQLTVLKLVTARLNHADIAYMLSGSIAMNYYAQPRLTRDIDIVVALRLEDAERVTDLFAAEFYIDVDAVREAIAQRGMFNIIHYASAKKNFRERWIDPSAERTF